MKESFWSNREEIFIGACLQFPLYFIVGWWALPIMAVCGILWHLGGWKYGSKIFRRIGVPLCVCLSTFCVERDTLIFLAVPFMVWVSPFSYGKDGWLWKWLKNDFLVRLICFGWCWSAFSIAFSL